MTDDAPMRVGDLARRTGLSVRTLHHHDEIGLLAPLGRTGAGQRVYGRALAREWRAEAGMGPEVRASIGNAMALSD